MQTENKIKALKSLNFVVSYDDDLRLLKANESVCVELVQSEIYKITGLHPTPCDVNYGDWYINF